VSDFDNTGDKLRHPVQHRTIRLCGIPRAELAPICAENEDDFGAISLNRNQIGTILNQQL
jgi:endonuclease YncB( thermonuclease family)